MSEVTKQKLAKVAKEMNEVMYPLEPPIRVRGDRETILDDITKAAGMIEAGDSFTDETLQVFEELGFYEALEIMGVPVTENNTSNIEKNEKEERPEETEGAIEDVEPIQEEHATEPDEPAEPIPEPETTEDPQESEPVEKKTPVSDLSTDEIEKIVEERKITRQRTEGPSGYTMAIELMCKDPEIEFDDLCAVIEEKSGYEMTSKLKANIRTGYSQVKKIYGLMQENGIIK